MKIAILLTVKKKKKPKKKKIQKKNKGNVIKNVEKVVCVTGFVSNDEAKKFDFGPMVCNIIVPDTRFDELFTRRGHVVLLVVVTLLA